MNILVVAYNHDTDTNGSCGSGLTGVRWYRDIDPSGGDDEEMRALDSLAGCGIFKHLRARAAKPEPKGLCTRVYVVADNIGRGYVHHVLGPKDESLEQGLHSGLCPYSLARSICEGMGEINTTAATAAEDLPSPDLEIYVDTEYCDPQFDYGCS